MEPRDVRAAVRAKYEEAAGSPEGLFPYPVGRASAEGLGYRPDWLARVPAASVEGFVGVGNPFPIARPVAGERVLDVGCGRGLDVFVASLLVGEGGRAQGLDLTPAMVDRARAAAAGWSPDNVAFEAGDIEALPFPDGSFDVVISNGALNLVPDKDRAFREIARVLAPGGRFAAADLLVVDDVPAEMLDDAHAWST